MHTWLRGQRPEVAILLAPSPELAPLREASAGVVLLPAGERRVAAPAPTGAITELRQVEARWPARRG